MIIRGICKKLFPLYSRIKLDLVSLMWLKWFCLLREFPSPVSTSYFILMVSEEPASAVGSSWRCCFLKQEILKQRQCKSRSFCNQFKIEVPYFSDYKTYPPTWEENGGASYSPNVAYLAH